MSVEVVIKTLVSLLFALQYMCCCGINISALVVADGHGFVSAAILVGLMRGVVVE